MKIKWEKISGFLKSLYKKAGIAHSDIIIDGLVETSLRGVDSHGIRLASHYLREQMAGRINSKSKISFQKNGTASYLMDADHAFGVYAGNVAMAKAISLAKKTGIASVAVKNGTHFAAAEIYSRLAAKQGMIGISLCNTESYVVPYHGDNILLGTNPLACAMPGGFCLDMATSSVAWNKVLVCKQQNKKLDADWAVDENFASTDDPNKAVFLRHFGGYKGYDISMMIELLCVLTTGMPFGFALSPMYPVNSSKRKLSYYFIAIKIGDLRKFKARVLEMRKRIKMQKNVLFAGEDREAEFLVRKKEGIDVPAELIAEFNELAQKVNLKARL